MAPTGAPAPQPLFELRLWNDRFSREFLQTPEQLSHSSVMSRMSWRMCVCERATENVQLCVPFSVCVSVCDWTCELRTYKSVSRGKCIGGWGAYSILASHTCGSMSKILCIEGETLTSVAAAHQKVPKVGTWSSGGPPKHAPCHLLCVSLTFCLSYTSVFSPRLPSTAHPLFPLPFFFSGRRSDIY